MGKRRSIYLSSLGILILSPTFSNAAEDTERFCNLQGRELALRAAETLLPELDTASRQELAVLAEETCLDYAGMQGTGDGHTPGISGVDEQVKDSESGGIFSDITRIDPQDRVRRPGLKRP